MKTVARPGGGGGTGLLRAGILAALVLPLWAAAAVRAADAPEKPAVREAAEGRLFLRADRRELDYKQGIGILVGNVYISPPRSNVLILADAAVVWLERKEAYLEGNVRIYRTLGNRIGPRDFDVPKPDLGERTGLEPSESLEKAGDLDSVIRSELPEAFFTSPDEPQAVIAVDTRVPVSEAERVYVNWAEGTGYLVRPTLRFAEADRVANWVITAPSAEGIATYEIPIVDKDGKPTGKTERRSHYVMNNATFTACTFKDPHTRFTATSADWVDGDRATLSNVEFHMGDVPIIYLPYLYVDLEYKWPQVRFLAGRSSRLGFFFGAVLDFQLAKHTTLSPRFLFMSDRGMSYGLGGTYAFHDKDIRGALDLFWLSGDTGQDFLSDTSRTDSPWPAAWPAAMGPLPGDLPMGVTDRYRVKFTHQQEYPEHWEFDFEFQKFSDAGVYREFFEEEFKTEKPPETRALLKYGRDNWFVYIHMKKRINDFLTQTEYLPQMGFNIIAQPLGGGFLFTSRSQLAYVTTRFADTRRRLGQSIVDITRIQLDENEFGVPPDLTLRENDTDGLSGWRFDTANIVSRPFQVSIFNIEPYVGWRGSWFEHGIDPRRGGYTGVTPPVGPPLPPGVAMAPDHTGSVTRSQVLAGGRITTEFHRMYDVSDSPILRRFFPYGMRHIIVPEINYTYESKPTAGPERLPENDEVTEQRGLHRINFALRNRLQTRRAPEMERNPAAPLGGEWFRRKLAAEEAMKSDPVNVVDLDMDIDYFPEPGRDNVNLRGTRVRDWSNLRTNLSVRPSRRTTIFFDTEFAPEDGKLEVMSAGVQHRFRPNLVASLSNSYHFHDVSLIRVALAWDIDPKWSLSFDVSQKISGGGSGKWDRTMEVTRRFHEWQLTLGYQFNLGQNASAVTFHVGPTLASIYRPSWLFQPRSVAAFTLVESAR